MSETVPPPIVAPPPVSPPGSGPSWESPPAPEPPKPSWLNKLGPIGVFLLAVGKWILPALKLLKGAKFLVTGLSMIVSVWFYALWYGFPFALGFVLCILVHELGHVFFAWREGVPVTAPVFIPGMGALIIQKRGAKSAFGEALIGIGGPLFGTVAALACWGLYAVTGNGLFLALAFTGFLINLFNMAPVYPLDGGWIMACLSPYVLIVGYIGLIWATIAGYIHNPMIFILVLLSAPRVWEMLKRGHADPADGVPTTKPQRIGMGVAYIGLAAFLAWGMGHTHLSDARMQRHLDTKPKAVAMLGERG